MKKRARKRKNLKNKQSVEDCGCEIIQCVAKLDDKLRSVNAGESW